MTTLFPTTHVAFSLSMPDGRRWNLYFFPSTTMVCPALDPPATLAPTSYSYKCDRDDAKNRSKGAGER